MASRRSNAPHPQVRCGESPSFPLLGKAQLLTGFSFSVRGLNRPVDLVEWTRCEGERAILI